ncbi:MULTISPECIES: response regulator [unclassified Imperialibacter]|uniref:response regulator n=1 Tax=unclassified Imperialibacter TaxID=2629706 RepID=UPI0012567286
MSKRVLVIDDEKNIRDSIKDYLEFYDYDVKLANNGKAGVELALEWIPDIVISDLKMPELTGFGVLEKLRATDRFRLTPIFILSAMTDTDTQNQLRNLGATQFVPKPFRLPELVQLIEDC